jgi:adenosylhomocysteine nucleosidase
MSRCVAILAALPREVAALVGKARADRDLLRRGISLYRIEGAVVVAAGMGAQRAAFAVEAALSETSVTMLVSTGLAGACVPGLPAGLVVEAHVVVDTKTGERFTSDASASESARVTLATTDTIATVREKARLAATYGAQVVDMEAATVARLARAHGLPFRAIKGVSDSFDVELASLAQFAGERGSFRTGAFALHTALRPWTWREAIELGRGSTQALAALDVTLKKVIAGKS